MLDPAGHEDEDMIPHKKYTKTTSIVFTPQQREFLESMSIDKQMSVGEIIRAHVNSLMAQGGAI